MPLSLAHQFSRIALRYLFAPSCILNGIGLLGIGALLSYISNAHRADVIDGSLPSLEQRLVTGDYGTLNQLLRGTAKALSLQEALILTPKGRVVAAYPDSEKLHLSMSPTFCQNRKPIQVQSEVEVGTLCWSPPKWTHLLIPLSMGTALILCMGIVGIISYRKLATTLNAHAGELDRLTSGLIEPSGLSKYELQPASLEGHRLISAINAFSSSRDKIRDMELEAERTKTVQEIARQVAHDIRSPLSTLSVVSQVATGLTGEQSDLLRAAAQRIEAVADGLLRRREFATPEKAGTPATTPVQSHFSFNDVVDQGIRWKKVECRAFDNVKISYLPPATLMPLPAEIDPSELSRILSNLLNNAIDSLGAEVGHVGVTLMEDPCPTITISDSGFGMSPEMLARVGEAGVSYKKGGHGLGLSGAKKAMGKWRGDLRISSHVGKGTTVTLVFSSIQSNRGGLHGLTCNGLGHVLSTDSGCELSDDSTVGTAHED